jgi:hypothetical protein
MYPVNKPNIHNQPKQRERFSLKEGKYFWLSSIMKTYDKAKQEAWQKEVKERAERESDDSSN